MKYLILATLFLACHIKSGAQEFVKGFYESPQQQRVYKESSYTVRLPFKDDFSSGAINDTLWSYHNGVYLNNHMGISVPSQGIITFDATNHTYTPYDTTDRDRTLWGDSLVTSYIDLSRENPNSNIFLSFYYQAKGQGYMPKIADSLFVFFKNDAGIWEKEVAIAPLDTNIFLQEWLEINDPKYFHSEFQILFTNRATLGYTNAHWHIDYVEVDKNRTVQSFKNDIAIQRLQEKTINQNSVITWNKYKNNTAFYHQNTFTFQVRNLHNQAQQTNAFYSVLDQNNNLIYSETKSISLNALSEGTFFFNNPAYSGTYLTDSVYFTHSVSIKDPFRQSTNDTLVHIQKFENQLGYDDGNAELAYYLLMHPSFYIPAQTAVAYNFDANDTVRGFSIHLPKGTLGQGRKDFSIRIYDNINQGLNQDPFIYEETFLIPKYDSTKPYDYVYYVFPEAVHIPASKPYYVAIIQPTGGGSDSFYIGLDVHTNSSLNRYINVEGTWEASQIQGSLLLRPLLGKDISYLNTNEIPALAAVKVFPNPSEDVLHITSEERITGYTIFDLTGRKLQQGALNDKHQIDIRSLQVGQYLLVVSTDQQVLPAIKFLKK